MPRVEFSDLEYRRSHGRAPRGYGYWGFLVMDESTGKPVADFFVHGATLGKAKQAARAHVKANMADALATGCLYLEVAP